MNKRSIILLLVCLAAAPSWSQNHEKRNVPGFVMISFRLPGTLILRQGQERSVEIEAPPGVIPKIDTRVTAGRLIIEPKVLDRKTFHQDFDYVKIYVTTLQLEDLHINGSGKAIGEGKFDLEKITLNLAGAGTATLDMVADSVLTNITGSGQLQLSGKIFFSHNNISGSGKTIMDASIEGHIQTHLSGSGEMNIKGSADLLELMLAGSGKFNGPDFSVNKANIILTGGGQATLTVNQSLETEVRGNGSITYKGTPAKVTHKGNPKARITKVD